MEFLLEIFLQFLGEAILQLLAELGFRALSEPFLPQEQRSGFVASIAYFCFGCVLGGASLKFAPHLLIHQPNLQIANLFLTPLLVALSMSWLGTFRTRKGEDVLRIDTLAFAFLFAFGMALIRWKWALS